MHLNKRIRRDFIGFVIVFLILVYPIIPKQFEGLNDSQT